LQYKNQELGMDKDLKDLLEELVRSGDAPLQPETVLPAPEAIESDTEEAWNDFQDSQIAFDRGFEASQKGPL
jgi:hypothetical protein